MYLLMYAYVLSSMHHTEISWYIAKDYINPLPSKGGLLPLVRHNIASQDIDTTTRDAVNKVLEFISKKASGDTSESRAIKI